MNMTSRITNDCNAVGNGLRKMIYENQQRFPREVLRRMDAFVVILEQLKEDVQKDNNESQNRILEYLRSKQ